MKYVQVAPIGKSNTNIFLQFCRAPRSNYVIQATTNFPNWSVIGNTTADFNGIYRFEDTNAAAYPNRFYKVLEP